jgi:hypothetical protein
MSGHTRGQWIAVGAWVEHPDDDVADICSCDPETIGQGKLGRGYSEICANARLIAAAPDLLEVCRRLSHVSLFAVDEDVASIIMRACDAVSKAIGGKP